MKTRIQIVSILVTLCFAFVLSNIVHAVSSTKPNVEEQPTQILWQSWSSDPFEQARKEHRFIFIEIKDDACPWCNLMKDKTFQDKKVIQLINDHFIPVQLDVHSDQEVLRQFHATLLPMILILDADQHVISQSSGYISPEALLLKFEPVAKRKAP